MTSTFPSGLASQASCAATMPDSGKRCTGSSVSAPSASAAVMSSAARRSAALADGALTELPVHRFPLSGIVAAQEACEAGPLGKVLVVPS